MNKQVLIIAPVHDMLLRQFTEHGFTPVMAVDWSREEILKNLGAYQGLITSNRLKIDREVIDAGTNLAFVGRMGSGMEIVDIPYATARGIHCYSSPDGNANAVAEQALAMLLVLKQNLFRAADEVKRGLWFREENRGHEIENITVGIVGVGHNGGAFAHKLAGMDVTVLGYDKYRKGYGNREITECEDIAALQESADVISFHVPLTEETTHYFDAAFLKEMKKPFYLLNISRGRVVAQDVVLEGLRSGKILAAALDVWETEPIGKMSPAMKKVAAELLSLPNFIGTPHIGGYTYEALYKMSRSLCRQILKDEKNI